MNKRADKWAAHQKTAAIFSLAFALFALLPPAINTYSGPDTTPAAHAAREAPRALQSLLLRLAETETAYRSYFLTRLDRHLAYATALSQKVLESMAGLKASPAAVADPRQRYNQLQSLVQRRQQELEALATVRREKPVAAISAALSAANVDQTDMEIRTLLGAMIFDANELLDKQDAVATAIRIRRVYCFVAALNLLILALGFRLVSRYITQRQSVEHQLKEATDAAEAANTAKSAFLANMSHEIRTPLTAILGYTDMLVEVKPGAQRTECLNSIRRNARHLLDLLNDVLDISKIEAGRMTAERIQFDLPQVAAEVASMMRPRAVEKGLDFRLLFDGPIPQKIKSDPVRLKQILVNLVGNAIKFTEKGRVEICLSCQVNPPADDAAPKDCTATLRLDVIDTGIGLTTMQIERIFQPFTQGDESMTRRFGGSGLGLTISRRLAVLLGGAITVESKPLEGSTFTVTLEGVEIDTGNLRRGITESTCGGSAPALMEKLAIAPVAEPEPAPAVATPALSARILFAEDGKDNQRLISSHLRRAGAEVTLADNGRIALERVQAQSFDIILMDMQMPEMDGYDATRELRRLGFTLPIVAVTAHAMTGDREKCLAAGCTDYLSKPVDRDQLLRVIQKYLDRSPQRALQSEYADDPDMRELVNLFITGFPEQIGELTTLLDQQQLEPLHRAVHQLKGAGGGYGFPAITTLAAKAEQSLRTAQPLEEIVSQVGELIELLEKIHRRTDAAAAPLPVAS